MAGLPPKPSPASPLHYPPSQTALILLDFQTFTIDLCGPSGKAAVQQAKVLRDWAVENGVVVLHSIVNINGTPAETGKGAERVVGMLAKARDTGGGEEAAELALDPKNKNEYLVLKPPGIVSGLKSVTTPRLASAIPFIPATPTTVTELLIAKGIKSLIIAGLATSGAVLRTVIPATDEGFVVTVVGDACADPREGVHGFLMDNILPSRAWIVGTAGDVVEGWWEG